MYGDPSRSLPGTVEEYARAIALPGTTIAAAKVLRSWNANFEQLGQMMPEIGKAKVRLIWGDKDPVVPVRSATELMRELPSAELVVIPSAGHLPYEELPEQFNKAVLDLLLAKPGPSEVAQAPRPA
jgi:pimeloyl-ACP methyl ester carboxylesterase